MIINKYSKLNGIKYKSIYAFSVFLMISSYYHLSYTWGVLSELIGGLTVIVSLMFYLVNKTLMSNAKSQYIICCLIIWYVYYALFVSANYITAFVFGSISAINTIILLLSPINVKKYLFNYISHLTTCLLTISIAGWFLFLIGVKLPYNHLPVFNDGYHVLYNYYFFVLNINTQFDIPRFAGMFLEPGQMASVVCILLFTNIILRGRKFDILIQSISIILSFSLAGWLVAILTYIFYSIVKENSIKYLIVIPLVIFACSLAVNRINKESVVGQLIINRILYDEDLIIAGNNRTNEDFNLHYKKFLQSNKKNFGVHRELQKKDWTRGNSGYKLLIVNYGIIGFSIILFLLFLIIIRFYSKYGLVVFSAYFILGMIRNFWLNPYWLFTLLCALAIIQYNNRIIRNRIREY